MHFFDFNIGEYAKKTAHLTNEEDIAYRRALDMYYDTEKPMPYPLESGGLVTLSRRLRVNAESLKNVLDEFFPCGQRGGVLECDHKTPVSLGGGHNDENLTTACKKCNRKKSATPYLVWVESL